MDKSSGDRVYTEYITLFTGVKLSKTTILSFRISGELKQSLEQRSKAENKNLTEYVRNVLSESQAQKIQNRAAAELSELEVQAKSFAAIVEKHGKNYERHAGEIARLGRDMNSAVSTAVDGLTKSRWLEYMAIGAGMGILWLLVFVGAYFIVT
ncbi:hypothetical protein C4953_22650 [Salmonella enterica subsp. enterica serovar Litchfield]|nr:hypothetical protein [Salmonella enterica]EDX7762021.1 hypothetical protein [Salmonella enterica subsp. enterica serovar Thompson]EEL3745460.1 hypothetical protein [Salmonella enterica subsp. enterica serovar Litchfield]EBU0958374.1 hypothetical protein [Salmonella enterica]ECC3907839.1 hypothetical protein [Salmonella enterica]